MKRIKLLTLSCLMSLSLPSFAQFSPDHKVSLDKGDIKSFIGDKESKGERKVYKGDELTTIGMPVGGICAGQMSVEMVHWPIGGLQTMPIILATALTGC